MLVGCAAATGFVSLGVLAIAPAAGLGALLATRPDSRRSAYGLVSGVGLLLLYVAWVQRAGPGTTCWRTATASGCDQHLNPLPWLAGGVLLVVAGAVLHTRHTTY